MDGAKVFFGAIVSENKIKSAFNVFIFFNFFFDFTGQGAFYSGAKNVVNRIFDKLNAGFNDVE